MALSRATDSVASALNLASIGDSCVACMSVTLRTRLVMRCVL